MCVFVPAREIKTVGERGVGVLEIMCQECLRAVCENETELVSG